MEIHLAYPLSPIAKQDVNKGMNLSKCWEGGNIVKKLQYYVGGDLSTESMM